MTQLSISQFCSRRWSFFQDVVRYASWGIHHIGIWREKLAELDLDEAIDLLEEMQLSVSSLSWAGGFTGSNGLSFNEAVEDARRAIEMAHMLRADCLIVHPGARNGHTDRHLRRLLRDALDQLVPHADDYGVRMALEPTLSIVNSPWNFLTTFDEHLTLIDPFPAERLGLVMDLYYLGDRDALRAALPTFAHRIALVQLADYTRRTGREDRVCLGTGAVPLGQWLKALHAANYQGPVEIELHGKSMTPRHYQNVMEQSLEHVRRAASVQRSKSDSAKLD